MRNGRDCFCSGVLEKATLREDSDCNVDCLDDPAGNKRKCGGTNEIFSVWRLGEDYCPFKSRFESKALLDIENIHIY